MSVSICAGIQGVVCSWVFTCSCGQFRSAEFATHAEAYSAFTALAEGGSFPAHAEAYCFGTIGGGVEPAHAEWWDF
jgi:hypothetical protein